MWERLVLPNSDVQSTGTDRLLAMKGNDRSPSLSNMFVLRQVFQIDLSLRCSQLVWAQILG